MKHEDIVPQTATRVQGEERIMKKRIVLSGITGKMGKFLLQGFEINPDYEVVAGMAEEEDLTGAIPIYSDIKIMDDQVDYDVFVDFTRAAFSKSACAFMLKKGIPIIVGTTGFNKDDILELKQIANEAGTSGIIAPNFAIGIVLLHKYLQMGAKYFKNFAVYEYHHLSKYDNPSGTAHYLADATRGDTRIEEVDIHGFRLPGVLATHTVVMSDESQKIELTHQSNNRHSFEEGVLLSLELVDSLQTLVYGLEEIV